MEEVLLEETQVEVVDKKTSSLVSDVKNTVETQKFGVSGTFKDSKVTELRDDVYVCCSCSCGSATFE